MFLRKLHKDYGLKIELVLMKEYKRLGLTMKELNILLLLFDNYPRKNTFSLTELTKKSDSNQNDVANIFNKLIEKEFVSLALEQKNNKTREIYILDNTYYKITNLLTDDIKLDIVNNNKNDIKKTIELLEDKLNRLLSANELDRIRVWYENLNYNHNDIIGTIKATKNNTSIIHIEKLLANKITHHEPLDDKTAQILDNIFKGL